LPVEVKRTSDFPIGDVKGNMEKDELITVEFLRSYNGEFFKAKPMLIGVGLFKKLLKDTGAKPAWQWWAVETAPNGAVITDPKTGKPKKKFYDVDNPEKLQRATQTVV